MSIGKQIKKIRNMRGMTQSALAKSARISRSYLGDLEGSRYNPSVDTLRAIAAALHVDVSSFLDDEPVSGLSEDDEMMQILQELKDRPELKTLFSSTARATTEDILRAAKFLDAMNNDQDD